MKENKKVHPEAEKLYENIKKYGGEETARRIAFSAELPLEPSAQETAEWVNSVSKLLDETFDEETIKKIRTACYCTDASKYEETKAWIGEIYRSSENMRDFVNKMNEKGAGWSLEGDTLFTIFTYCGCPMLEKVKSFKTKTWCYCTLGYSKALFESIFGYEVNAELIKSIKLGDEVCLMKISKK